MNHLLLLMCLVLSTSLHAEGGGFVGNGGNGIEINGQLRLLDIWSQLENQPPYVGEHIDESLTPLPDLEIYFAYSRELLQRKLTDINVLYSGAGDYVLAAIRAHNWRLVNAKLTPINDMSEIFLFPVEDSIYQIANRFGNTVRVNAESYRRLSEVDQVGLILHEAISSLLKPLGVDQPFQTQPSLLAREVTGGIFDPASYTMKPGPSFWELAIPEPMPLATVRHHAKWDLRYGVRRGNRPVTLRTTSCSPLGPYDLERLTKFVQGVCKEIKQAHLSYPQHAVWYSSNLRPRPVAMHVESYRASEILEQNRIWFALNPQGADNRQFRYLNEEKCLRDLQPQSKIIESELW